MDKSNKWLLIGVGLIIGILIGVGVGAAAFYHPNQSATIVVSVYRSPYFSGSSHFDLYLNGYNYTSGNIAPGETIILHVIAEFPSGVVYTYQIVSLQSTDHGYYSITIEVSNGGNYPISFNA